MSGRAPDFPIIPILEYLGIEVVRGKARCKWHADTKPSATVTPNGLGFRCWTCGKAGDAVKLLRDEEELSFADAVSLAAELTGVADTSGRSKPGWGATLLGP